MVWKTQSDESGNMRLPDMKAGDDLMTREGVWQRRATGVVFLGWGGVGWGGVTILLTFKVQEFKYMLALCSDFFFFLCSDFLNED